MASLSALVAMPFTLFMSQVAAHPVATIVISGVTGSAALATGHDHWAVTLLCFGASVMIWQSEQENRPAPTDEA